MLVKNIQFRGVGLYVTPAMLSSGKILAVQKADLGGVKTRYEKTEMQLRHGVSLGPILLGEREVELRGAVVADDESDRESLVKTLDKTFAPKVNVSLSGDDFEELEFQDEGGKNWVLNVKVSEPVKKENREDGDEGIIFWSVKLVAEDPLIYSKTAYMPSDVNRTAGVGFGFGLPVGLTESWMEIDYAGTVEGQLNLILTAEEDDATDGTVRVTNLTDDTELVVEGVSMNSGDVLKVDSVNKKITLNGSDITNQKVDGSDWPVLSPGVNQVRTDTNVEYARCSVEYKYKEIWL